MIMLIFFLERKDDWISEKYIHITHHINELKENKVDANKSLANFLHTFTMKACR